MTKQISFTKILSTLRTNSLPLYHWTLRFLLLKINPFVGGVFLLAPLLFPKCLAKSEYQTQQDGQSVLSTRFSKIYLRHISNSSKAFLISKVFHNRWNAHYQFHPYFTVVHRQRDAHFWMEFKIQKFNKALLPKPSADFPQRILFWIQVEFSLANAKPSLGNINIRQTVSISHLEMRDQIWQNESEILQTEDAENEDIFQKLFEAIDQFLLRGKPLPLEPYPGEQ